MISIIIVTYNGKEHTLHCLHSLQSLTLSIPFEIIVVDNASSDGSVEMIKREFPNIVLLTQSSNNGFGKANNIGAKAAHGEYLFFVNNDTLFQQDILTPLKEFLENHISIGIAAPMLLNSDLTYQHSYGKYPSIINEFRTKRDMALFTDIPKDRSPKQVDWVSFAAVMIRRSAFEKIGGFDELYFMYFEDVDVCLRLKNEGFSIMYLPAYSLIHLCGASRSQRNADTIRYEYRRSQLIYYSKHRSLCQTFLLRFYLLIKYILIFIGAKKNDKAKVLSIIKLAVVYHAHSS
jgi:GT2 family glycosyltransferase